MSDKAQFALAYLTVGAVAGALATLLVVLFLISGNPFSRRK